MERLREKPDCDICKALRAPHGDESELPCAECLSPLPWPENEDAVRVYLLTEDQLIVGIAGSVGPHQLAIWEVIDRYNIKDPVRTFEKVIDAFRHFIGIRVQEFETNMSDGDAP